MVRLRYSFFTKKRFQFWFAICSIFSFIQNMYNKNYRYQSKDFFYLQRFPLFLGLLLFLAAELFFLAPVTALVIIHSLASEQPSLLDHIEHSLMLLVLCVGHYYLFFFTLRTRQGVGDEGVYNVGKGLLPWEQIGTIHLASENCPAEKYEDSREHKAIFALLSLPFSPLNTSNGAGGAAIGGAFHNAQRKNQLILHVKGLEYKPRNSLLPRPPCGNVTFKVDLPVSGKSELIEQFSIHLKSHPDWERIQTRFLKQKK